MQHLNNDHTFEWIYVDLSLDAEELKEEFEITQLPALVLLSTDGSTRTQLATKQSATPQDADDLITKHCTRSLVLDADF